MRRFLSIALALPLCKGEMLPSFILLSAGLIWIIVYGHRKAKEMN